jgi:hypothetical protein
VNWLERHPGLIASAGLIVAPAAWAVGTQLGLILPYAECGSSVRPLLINGLLLTAVALWSGWVSWRAPWEGRTGHFAARVFALLAAAISFSMLLQTLASVILTGCER